MENNILRLDEIDDNDAKQARSPEICPIHTLRNEYNNNSINNQDLVCGWEVENGVKEVSLDFIKVLNSKLKNHELNEESKDNNNIIRQSRTQERKISFGTQQIFNKDNHAESNSFLRQKDPSYKRLTHRYNSNSSKELNAYKNTNIGSYSNNNNVSINGISNNIHILPQTTNKKDSTPISKKRLKEVTRSGISIPITEYASINNYHPVYYYPDLAQKFIHGLSFDNNPKQQSQYNMQYIMNNTYNTYNDNHYQQQQNNFHQYQYHESKNIEKNSSMEYIPTNHYYNEQSNREKSNQHHVNKCFPILNYRKTEDNVFAISEPTNIMRTENSVIENLNALQSNSSKKPDFISSNRPDKTNYSNSNNNGSVAAASIIKNPYIIPTKFQPSPKYSRGKSIGTKDDPMINTTTNNFPQIRQVTVEKLSTQTHPDFQKLNYMKRLTHSRRRNLTQSNSDSMTDGYENFKNNFELDLEEVLKKSVSATKKLLNPPRSKYLRDKKSLPIVNHQSSDRSMIIRPETTHKASTSPQKTTNLSNNDTNIITQNKLEHIKGKNDYEESRLSTIRKEERIENQNDHESKNHDHECMANGSLTMKDMTLKKNLERNYSKKYETMIKEIKLNAHPNTTDRVSIKKAYLQVSHVKYSDIGSNMGLSTESNFFILNNIPLHHHHHQDQDRDKDKEKDKDNNKSLNKPKRLETRPNANKHVSENAKAISYALKQLGYIKTERANQILISKKKSNIGRKFNPDQIPITVLLTGQTSNNSNMFQLF